ncbi:hypothetical protein C1Y40_03799 [Mycobacterium talmoniae]|uniref:Uncharacterized protein n=1 Tax=Mycobacterium talmoniae TaxID=1858794 RepID=A0A2S8BHE3_9MYCO|nr:hypothetical protein C1Y40_03799 [Mycobacterium talmoniae]
MNTDAGTPAPVSATRARLVVPAVPSSTVTDVTRRPRIPVSVSVSRSAMRRGNVRTPRSAASVVTRAIPCPRCAASASNGGTRRAVCVIAPPSVTALDYK